MPYLTASQIRTGVDALADTGRFPDATLSGLVAEFESIAERFCGVAFGSRTTTMTTVLDTPAIEVLIPHPDVSAVGTVAVDGTVTSDWTWMRSYNGIRFGSMLPAETAVSAAVTHGTTTVPEEISRACAQYVRSRALSAATSTGRDVIALATEAGTTRFVTPDWDAGRPTGSLDVDPVLVRHRRRYPSFGASNVLR